MLVQNTNDNIIDNKPFQNRNNKVSNNTNSITVSTSPCKSRKYYLTRTTSFDKTYYRT